MAVQQDIAPRARSPEGGHRAPLGLVLTGGGARAAYQVGALAAIAEAVPDLAFPIVTGVSAGAINAAFLAAHPGPFAAAIAALRAEWGRLTAERVYRVRPGRWGRALLRWLGAPALGGRAGPPLVRGVFDPQPLRALLAQRLDLSGIDRNIAAGRLRAAALSATPCAPGSPWITCWRRRRCRSSFPPWPWTASSTATAACARPRRSPRPSTSARRPWWWSPIAAPRRRATPVRRPTRPSPRSASWCSTPFSSTPWKPTSSVWSG